LPVSGQNGVHFILTPGQAGVCPVARQLLGHLHEGAIVLADKAYDADWVRRQIEAAGAASNIPPMAHRCWKPCLSPVLYQARKRWPAFIRFLDDGRICLTNNAAERALRGIAIGRKAWLFAASDRGGDRAAALYTLIAMAKLNDIDPQAWLAEVLRRIADHPASRPRSAPALALEEACGSGSRRLILISPRPSPETSSLSPHRLTFPTLRSQASVHQRGVLVRASRSIRIFSDVFIQLIISDDQVCRSLSLSKISRN
jgi:hypothetical protein